MVFGAKINSINSSNEGNFSNSLSIGSKRVVVEISDMYFNRLVKIPGVLVEVGFLSNSYDRNNLINLDYQEKISDKIIDGIINYFTM